MKRRGMRVAILRAWLTVVRSMFRLGRAWLVPKTGEVVGGVGIGLKGGGG